MALGKNTITKQGFEASYWKLATVTIDIIRKEASCILNLYASKDIASNVDTFIESKVVTTNGEMLEDGTSVDNGLFDKYFGINNQYTDIYNACYELAKEVDSYFEAAENI